MADIYKLSLIFQLDEYGWTETHYRLCEDIDEALIVAKRVRIGRCKLLAKQAICNAVRVSNVVNPRLSYSERWLYNAADTQLNADNVSNAVLCTLNVGTQNKVNMALRGLPDQWLEYNATTGRVDLIPFALGWVQAYMNVLVHENLRQRVTPRPDKTALMHKITSWDAAGDSVSFVTAADGNWNKGDFVVVRQVKNAAPEQLKLINKRQYVLSRTTTTTVINVPIALITDINLLKGGFVYRARPDYVLITKGAPVKATTRKTGKYPLVPRARAKKPAAIK